MRSDRLKKLICVLLCLALSLTLFGCGKSEEPETTAEPEKTPQIPEITETIPEDVEPRYPEAYAAYLQVLDNNGDDIRMYTWQYPRQEEPSAVLLWDIGGDECPELLYIAARENDFSYDVWEASLEIWTFFEGKAVQVHSELIDLISANAAHYCLFQKEDSKSLFLYRVLNGETRAVEFALEGSSLQELHTLDTRTRTVSYYPKETTLDYMDDGEIIPEEVFIEQVETMLDGMQTILLRSAFLEDAVLEAGASGKESLADTTTALTEQLWEQLERDRICDVKELQEYVGQWFGNNNYLIVNSIDEKKTDIDFSIHRLRVYENLSAHRNEAGDLVFEEEKTGLEGKIAFFPNVIMICLESTPKGFKAYHEGEQGKGRIYIFSERAS